MSARCGDLIVPGLYDDNGVVHFYPHEFLEGQGVIATAENRDTILREFLNQWRARYPGVPIHEEAETP